ncbi:hypothetical protein EXIGLDRAFT_717111 [Exidia glandulosa HHB12029]|uniref:Uncharacterized protein n=1 Tax=Exidia glandulosa HHB12029 TaxID=1314781 RepID=A0A166AMT0_EXIGL|nr:hypothetical protein EXIGLDRAFT_717111 [Exidia glandulosa HHB12029]
MASTSPRNDGMRPAKRQRLAIDDAHSDDKAVGLAYHGASSSASHGATVSPGMRLNGDVLHQVILESAAVMRYNAQFLRTLSSISKSWRSATLDAASVWATIDFSYKDYENPSDPRGVLMTVADVEEWLTRSGKWAKDVWLECHKMPVDELEALFELLQKHSRYIRSLYVGRVVTCDVDPYDFFLDYFVGFAGLTGLNFRRETEFGLLIDDYEARSLILAANPSITCISLEDGRYLHLFADDVRNRLTGLALEYENLYHVIIVLKSNGGFPALTHLAIDHLAVPDDTIPELTALSLYNVVLNPLEFTGLRVLYLGVPHTRYNAWSNMAWGTLFRLLVTPQLEELALSELDDKHPTATWNIQPLWNLVLSYRPPLRRLYLQGFCFDGIDLREFFSYLPLLERLVLLATEVSLSDVCSLFSAPQPDRWLCPRLADLCIAHPGVTKPKQRLSRAAVENLVRARLVGDGVRAMVRVRLDHASIWHEGRGFYWFNDPADAGGRRGPLVLFTEALQPTAWWQVCTGAETLLWPQ